MTKNYLEIIKASSTNLSELSKAIPDVTKGFSSMSVAAKKNGALDEKTKELIALSIGVANKCDACIGFHAKALVQLKATREEVAEALGMCIYMGGGPVYMYAADALLAFDQFSANT